MPRPCDDLDTHEVVNQPPPLVGYDAFGQDRALVETVLRYGAGWAADRLGEAGRLVGGEHVQNLSRLANRFPPELRTHDRYGHRLDAVEYHPAWHELMALAIGQETHALAWSGGRSATQMARGALFYLWHQAEAGICCPVAMTHAAVPTLRQAPMLAAEWEPRLCAAHYDPRPLPAPRKTGALAAMALTEKQGGSDLRAVSTRAEPAGDGGWHLVGHKWFFSAPMSDLVLTLARTARGITCFAVPGWLPDGRRNRLHLQRLKDKCGNRANASAEVEYRGAWAQRLGEEGEGIRTLIRMAHLTRIDCALGSAALMRQALVQALHHATHRFAFQRALIDQPAMAAVLADLALESEAAMALAFRVVHALDHAESVAAEHHFARVGAPVAKFWICKRTPALVAEALECLGGNGYVEEHPLARLYREAPLNGIWEGAGNVIALDVLRALARSPASAAAVLDEVRQARGADRRLDALTARLEAMLADTARHEGQARRVVETIAVALQASLLLRHAPAPVASAFCATRLEARTGCFGTLPDGVDTGAILARARLDS